MNAPMDAADLYGLLTESLDAILSIVTIYFSVVSAYIAALHYFLRAAPVLLKLAAFAVLSGALAFLGLIIISVERLTASVVMGLEQSDPLPAAAALPVYLGIDLQDAAPAIYVTAVAAGWILAFMLYAALFYLTFLHRWREPSAD